MPIIVGISVPVTNVGVQKRVIARQARLPHKFAVLAMDFTFLVKAVSITLLLINILSLFEPGPDEGIVRVSLGVVRLRQVLGTRVGWEYG